jgi:hypothetical protein
MRPGQILEVLTDHPPAVDNVHAPSPSTATGSSTRGPASVPCIPLHPFAGASAARRVLSCQRS